MKFVKYLPIPLLFALSACTFEPDYQEPQKSEDLQKAISENFYHAPKLWANATPSDGELKGDWWAIFDDEVLSAYMKELKENNPNLKSAFYTVEQARENASMTESELYPWVSGEASMARKGLSKNAFNSKGSTYDSWLIGTALTWDLDFFGRVRNLLASDTAKAQALAAAYENTMLRLQAEMAISYFTLKQYNSEEILLRETIAVREEQVRLVGERLKRGTSILVDLRRAEQQLYESKAQYSGILKSRDLVKDYIALLLGKTRNQVVVDDTVLTDNLPEAPRIIPSELLQRRPDIAQAERLVFAANERIGAANAAFFPTVSITAGADLDSANIDTVLNASSLAWGVSPKIYIPIFQAGRLYAQRQSALFAHKQILEDYKSVVLKAIYEVEDALTSLEHLRNEYKNRDLAMKASKEVEALTKIQYDSGYVDYYEVSDSQRLALLNEREVISLKGSQYRTLIQLIVASGGKWQDNSK